jgi:adenylate cyclase
MAHLWQKKNSFVILGNMFWSQIALRLRKHIPLYIALAIAFFCVFVLFSIENNPAGSGWLSQRGLVHLLDLKVLDLKLQKRTFEKLPLPQVAVVAIDEKSIQRYGLWPWNRSVIGNLLASLRPMQPKAIAFDAVFADEDKSLQKNPDKTPSCVCTPAYAYTDMSPDEVLAKEIAQTPKTVLGVIHFYHKDEVLGVPKKEQDTDMRVVRSSLIQNMYDRETQTIDGQDVEVFRLDPPREWESLELRKAVAVQSPLPLFAQGTSYFGYFNASPDSDGMVRQIHLLNKTNQGLMPSLALAAAHVALQGDIKVIHDKVRKGRGVEGVSLAPGYDVHTDPHGRVFVNYYTHPERYFPVYSVVDVIEGKVPKEAFENKVVLFGMTAQGMFDLRPTPFSPSTPGVFVHAMVVQNILDQQFIERPYGMALVEMGLFVFIALLMGWVVPMLPVGWGLLSTAAFVCVLNLLDTWWVFPKGIVMMDVLPTLQTVSTFVAVSAYGYFTEGKEKRRIRQAFQHYLNASVVDEVLQDTSKLRLGGEKRVCTVLFSDIRGFTTLSENLPPEELVQMLNSYLSPMTDVVFKHGGTLDKYIGDAIMAIFGAPVYQEDQAVRACKVALEMLEKLVPIQLEWKTRGFDHLEIGIGLNTGPMSVGNMGSAVRFDYTAMGDHVNLGSRLESLTKDYGVHIIASEYTIDHVGDAIHARKLDAVKVKGKVKPVRVYEVLGEGKATGTTLEMIQTFEEGLDCYKQQHWMKAIAHFEIVEKHLRPGDPASQLFIARCKAFHMRPPGDDWDAVSVVTHK